MNKNSGLSCLLKLLVVQLIIFSISNLIIVIIDTYESLFRGDKLNPEKFINLKVLLIPILISIIIICIYIHLYKIKKAYLLIKKNRCQGTSFISNSFSIKCDYYIFR